ncbi:MAG: hypothetical protein PHF20_07750 [Halothiobacillaceae bacterium]|nr:hypothetical protein [Halothiobacillaceae bacterium]
MSANTMRTYIQTRGKNTDYQFLGASPPSAWWQDFRDATSFEQPTLIIQGDTQKWRCYLSGIASARADRVGTTIRYTLVMEGTCSDTTEHDYALRLVSAWLEEAVAKSSTQSGQGRLGKALDRVFDESSVEALLASTDVTDSALSALDLVAVDPPKPGWSGSWVSSMTFKPAHNAFLYRIDELLTGKEKGFAAWLNLLGTAEDVKRLAQKHEGLCAVLIDIPTDDFEGDGYEKIEKSLPKQPTPETPDPGKTQNPLPTPGVAMAYRAEGRAADAHKTDWLGKPPVVVALLIIIVTFVIVLSNTKPSATQDKPNPMPATTQR